MRSYQQPNAQLTSLLGAIALVVAYAAAISGSVGLIEDPALGRNAAIMTFMLGAAAAIVLTCKIDSGRIPAASTFRSGMTACVCVLGVAWLGSTFVQAHVGEIKEFAGTLLEDYPWMLAWYFSLLQCCSTHKVQPQKR